MKISLDPISTTSRSVLLFLAEHDLPVEIARVSLFQGEHLTPQHAALNPSKQVPTLEDGDFVLTECSGVLKYLADKAESPAYPTEPRPRARVNEVMDWLNTGFYRDFGYGVVYTQCFPQYRHSNPTTQANVVARGAELADKWFTVMNEHWLAGRGYLCGPAVSIADYLGAAYVSIADWIDYDLGRFANVARWLQRMRERPSWQETHDEWNALTASFRTQLAKCA